MIFQRSLVADAPRRVRQLLLLLALPCLVVTAAAATPASAAVARPGLPQNPARVTVSLSASETTLDFGDATTLTATANEDVGPTPYWIEIFDVSTGNLLAACGSGTTCTATSQVDAPIPHTVSMTQEYVAYVSTYAATLPTTGIQAASPVVWAAWSDFGYQVSLSVTGTISDVATAVATPSLSSAFAIQIYLEDGDGLELLTTCPAGDSDCAVSFTASSGGSTLVAFVSGGEGPRLPALVAASNIVTTRSFLIPVR
jgi:hypothetical protein